MNIIDIIIKKRQGQKLNELEINYVVNAYTTGRITDYQMSALLMAICINGMDEEETFFLTNAMLHSGETMNLDFLHGIKVDKHSTGGVGDKTTLIVLPIVASCGLSVAKMSGRGLGFTGGTIDKLESIPGFITNVDLGNFMETTQKVGMCISSQTGNLVPADKKIYALRDVTGTVDSIPLIASSIMSKKLASGADAIVLDVKVGRGALLKTYEESKSLAEEMVKIGTKFGKKTIAVLSNMKEPLGYNIGNALEVQDAIHILQGKGESRIVELCLTLAAYMIKLAKQISYEEALKEAKDSLESGKAYQKFYEFVAHQKGDITSMPTATQIQPVPSLQSGYIKEIDALYLANIALKLGAGRMTKEDSIDPSVGIVLKKKVGDYVKEGEILLEVHHNKEVSVSNVQEAFSFQETPVTMESIIYEVIE